MDLLDKKQWRYELKYYISHLHKNLIVSMISNLLEEDKHLINKSSYFVRSLYFDNQVNKGYFEKIHGLNNRKKFRMRIYNLNDVNVKFQIKHKRNNKILKETSIITREDAIKIQNCEYETLLNYKNKILNKAYSEFKKDFYVPVVLVDYKRLAFCHSLNNIRITFDTVLSKDETNLDLFNKEILKMPVSNHKFVVMEIKYNRFLPNWIKRLISIQGLPRHAISKYCLSRTY